MVMNSDLNTLVRATGGKILRGQGAETFRGVCIDSRALQADELFFCIAGDRFDGHDFMENAIQKKPAGIVLSRPDKLSMDALDNSETFVLEVKDTLRALQDLASFHRDQFPVRVVGITGTNGKSTTKEMLAGIAGTRFETLKTRGNFNNHIGLPLSVLDMEASHKVAVLEMGMSDSGEIRRLAEIARPEIGVITNVSQAHMEHLKTLKDVQAAKGELFESLTEEGTAIVNADDPLVRDLAKGLRARVITFGIEREADVKASDIRPSRASGFDFTVHLFDKQFSLHMPLLGYCNIYNALAAVAAGHTLGIPAESMNTGMSRIQPMGQRGEVIHHNEMTFINDAYNANPQSARQALELLKNFAAEGRKFFVLGDMLELGELAESSHRQLGEEIAAMQFDGMVAVGDLAKLAAEQAVHSGMNKDQVMSFESHAEAAKYLSEKVGKGDCLLFKGSRGAHMETVMEGLMA